MLVLGHLQSAADQKQLTGQGFVNNYRLFLLAAAPRSQTTLSWWCAKPKQMRHFLWSEICRMFNFCILVYFLRGSQHCGFQKVFPHLWQQIPFISACFLLLFLGCGTTGIRISLILSNGGIIHINQACKNLMCLCEPVPPLGSYSFLLLLQVSLVPAI